MKLIIRHATPRNEADRLFKAEAIVHEDTQEATIKMYGTEYKIELRQNEE